MLQPVSPVTRIWKLVQDEKSDISAIYFYAILSGLIQLSVPIGIQAIIGFVVAGTLSTSLVILIIVLITGVLLAGIMQVNQMKVIERLQQRIFVKYAYAFTDRIPKLDLKQIDGYYLPELVNRFFDTISLQKGISKLLLDLPIALIQILFGLILLSFYHPLFILFGLLLLLLLWLILFTTGNKGLQSSLAESAYKYQVVGWLEEMARIVKSFKFSVATGLHLKKSDEKTTLYLKARTRHFKVLLFQYKTLVAFKVFITASMLIAGVILLLNQQINIGQFVAAEIVILTVINSTEKIIINLDSVYDILTAVEKIGKITDKPIESSGQFQINLANGLSIEAKKLHFGYSSGKATIQDISFRIAPGEKVCIGGPDGSGKSTLLKLLSGIYSDFNGAILINNIPIGNYDLETLRKQTGIFFLQENIFHGTLWENLTMGRTDIDMKHLNLLTEQTGLSAFLSSLSNGYDTELDPTGKRLPKNVIQKILLVRSMLHKPALLIMEEPWLGIEKQYCINIQQLLLNLPDTTVIVSTNDPHFAADCHQFIRLGN